MNSRGKGMMRWINEFSPISVTVVVSVCFYGRRARRGVPVCVDSFSVTIPVFPLSCCVQHHHCRLFHAIHAAPHMQRWLVHAFLCGRAGSRLKLNGSFVSSDTLSLHCDYRNLARNLLSIAVPQSESPKTSAVPTRWRAFSRHTGVFSFDFVKTIVCSFV